GRVALADEGAEHDAEPHQQHADHGGRSNHRSCEAQDGEDPGHPARMLVSLEFAVGNSPQPERSDAGRNVKQEEPRHRAPHEDRGDAEHSENRVSDEAPIGRITGAKGDELRKAGIRRRLGDHHGLLPGTSRWITLHSNSAPAAPTIQPTAAYPRICSRSAGARVTLYAASESDTTRNRPAARNSRGRCSGANRLAS